jgi:hypothetical protein
MKSRTILAGVILLLVSRVCFGQGVHVDLPAIFSQSSSPMQIPGLTIVVCGIGTSGTPCSPTIQVFSDQALTQPITTLQTNGDGLFPFWIASGNYQYCASGQNIVTFCAPFTAAVTSGTGPTFNTITVNPTSNGVDVISSTRQTDTSPVGNFVNFKSLAGVTLFKVDINGNVTAPNIPAGTIDTGTGTTNKIPKFITGASGIIGNSGITDDGTTVSTSEVLNANGNSASGNVGLKYASGDRVIYVSPNGNDSNDGLSMGTAKLTPQAAFDTATSSGTVTGTVILDTGSYACPTTWRSNMQVIGFNAQYHSTYITSWGFSTTQNNAVLTCTSGSNVSLTSITNLSINGVSINFGNSGGGLVLNSVSASHFEHFGIVGAGSSTQDALQMKTSTTTGVSNNTGVNVFYDLYIHCNSSGVGQQANALSLTGAGAVNSGTFVTDNRFYNVSINGGIKNAIKFELNSDSNYFYGVQINNDGTAQGDALVFNGSTPGSAQDVANEVLEGVTTTGGFNHPISMGTTDGDHIQMSSAAEIVPNILGGAQTYVLETTGLGVPPVFNVRGTVKSTSIQATNNGIGTGSSLVVLGATGQADFATERADGAVDQKWWDFLNNGTQLAIRAVKDDNSVANAAIVIDRGAGATVNDVTIAPQLILSSKITTYNGAAVNQTGSNGVIPQPCWVSRTAQVAAITTTTIPGCASLATQTAYMFNATLNCTTTAAASTATLTITRTDTSNTLQTDSVSVNCAALGSASRTNFYVVDNLKSATSPQYAVSITGTPTFDVRVSVVQLGTN